MKSKSSQGRIDIFSINPPKAFPFRSRLSFLGIPVRRSGVDRLEITWKALGLLSFFCSATLRVSGQLPPDPFWLVFDAPTDVRIAGDGLEFGVVGVLLSEFGGDEGADGWSISIAT